MPPTPPLNATLALALEKILGAHVRLGKLEWFEVADDLVLALSGSVAVVSKEDYDRKDRELIRAREYLRALGITLSP